MTGTKPALSGSHRLMSDFTSPSNARRPSRRFLAAPACVVLLAVAMALAIPPRPLALSVFQVDPVINFRFSSGTYTEGPLVENRHFLLAGHDLSGLGWKGGRFWRHPYFAPAFRHGHPYALNTPVQNADTVSFSRTAMASSTARYVVESVFYPEHAPGVRTDLVVGRLTAPIPPEDHIGYFPTLRLPNFGNYAGLQVYIFGLGQLCGVNTVARCGVYDMLPFGHPDNVLDSFLFVTEWRKVAGQQARLEGNDSGRPTLELYHGKLAVLGTHSAISDAKDANLNVDVLLPGYFCAD